MTVTFCEMWELGSIRLGVFVFTGLDYWTGLLDWTTGLDYWTGLLDWTTGLTLELTFKLFSFFHNDKYCCSLALAKVYLGVLGK